MILRVHEASSATATFLFTDIEGSTQLLRAHRTEYAAILAEHHRILREQFAAYGGREIDNQGDSFFVAFARARDAVLAAAACQRALAGHVWPGGPVVRVRIGIHTGEAELALDRYVGLSVHRAARISAIGHGGQVLVSQTTAGLLDDEEGNLPGVALRDLGDHWLKDISRSVRLYQLDIDGLPATFPKLTSQEPPKRDRRRSAAALGAIALVIAAAATTVFLLTRGGGAAPKIEANSVVRIEPATLKAAEVVPVGDAPDLVVISGGYVWVTHHILRDIEADGVRNAGDRTLTRVDPSTGAVTVVGGGLAPCGLAADPSGDVWVTNCFGTSSREANVIRVDATTLAFKATWRVPWSGDFYRGLAYGGGSLWVSGGSEKPNSVVQVDPRTGTQMTIRLERSAGWLSWSEGYGDLWINNFDEGSLTRLHPATGATDLVDAVHGNWGSSAIGGETLWASDWSRPQVVRLRAVGSSRPSSISLPVVREAGTWNVAAGAGGIWATTPRDRAVWRIDPKTNRVTRIAMPHLPSGVAANANEVWVTVRGT